MDSTMSWYVSKWTDQNYKQYKPVHFANVMLYWYIEKLHWLSFATHVTTDGVLLVNWHEQLGHLENPVIKKLTGTT